VILFLEKTWFLWWIVAIILILRWFHLFASNAEETLDAPAAGEERTAVASGQFSCASATLVLIQNGVPVLKAWR
jgi:hypothetical protein